MAWLLCFLVAVIAISQARAFMRRLIRLEVLEDCDNQYYYPNRVRRMFFLYGRRLVPAMGLLVCLCGSLDLAFGVLVGVLSFQRAHKQAEADYRLFCANNKVWCAKPSVQ